MSVSPSTSVADVGRLTLAPSLLDWPETAPSTGATLTAVIVQENDSLSEPPLPSETETVEVYGEPEAATWETVPVMRPVVELIVSPGGSADAE